MSTLSSKNLGNILITGGAGFIGSNLIKSIIGGYKFKKIISIDNYSTGTRKNHYKDKRVIYINLDTRNILNHKNKILKQFKPKYVFHFAEFSRIVPSFEHIKDCWSFNMMGTFNVLQYVIKKKAKLIYSGSSSALGNKNNEHLSPYSWSKSKNKELIKNFSKWYNLNYTTVLFFNVYGQKQIKNHYMAAVIGIFEDQYFKNKPLTVVKPGNQKRDFTHVNDITNGTILAAIKGDKKEYELSSGKSYKIIDVAKMFGRKIKYLNARPGERFSGASNHKLAKKDLGYFPKYHLKEYIKNFISKSKKQ